MAAETTYECGDCGSIVPMDAGNPPPLPCLECNADDWQEVEGDA